MPRVLNQGRDLTAPEGEPSEATDVPVMVGTHFHSLDEKGRIIVPAKLRSALTDQFWMMLDDRDNVVLYNSSTGYSVLRHCEEMMAQNPEDEEIAAAVERIASTAELVTAESGWRVSIPEVLRFWAGLEKEMVSVGVVNHVVLWSRDKWEQAQTKRLQDTEARKMQAGMMRAAASTIKKADDANGQGQAGEIAAAQAEPRIAGIESLGRNNAGAGSTGVDPSAASAGDGSRVPRVLALSKVGR